MCIDRQQANSHSCCRATSTCGTAQRHFRCVHKITEKQQEASIRARACINNLLTFYTSLFLFYYIFTLYMVYNLANRLILRGTVPLFRACFLLFFILFLGRGVYLCVSHIWVNALWYKSPDAMASAWFLLALSTSIPTPLRLMSDANVWSQRVLISDCDAFHFYFSLFLFLIESWEKSTWKK